MKAPWLLRSWRQQLSPPHLPAYIYKIIDEGLDCSKIFCAMKHQAPSLHYLHWMLMSQIYHKLWGGDN